MELLNFTTYAEVRSMLGVSAKELADAVLELPHWMLATEQEVLDIDSGGGAVLSQYALVKAKDETAMSANELQFFKVTRLYVLYSVSWQLLQSADSFSPQDITDGKAAIKRLADRFDKLRPAIEGGMQRLKERLKDALQILAPGAAIVVVPERRMFLSTGLGTDPVTGT